jgi:hypothetical protein
MTTIQIIIAVAGYIGLLAAIMAGNWSIRHSLESQMKAFTDAINAQMNSFRAEINAQVNSFRAEIKAELRAESEARRGEIAVMRAETHALNEKVDRIDQVFQRLYQPVLPGKGD